MDKALPAYALYFLIFLLAYVSLVPFYYLENVGQFPLFKFIPFLSIILFLIVFCKQLYRDIDVPILLFLFMAIYLGICVLGAFYAQYKWIALNKSFYYAITGFSCCFIAAAIRKVDYRKFWICLSLVSCIVSLWGITEYLLAKDDAWFFWLDLDIPYFSGRRRISATLGNPLYLGGFLTLSIPGVVYLVITSHTLYKRLCWGGGGLIILLALLFTFSRGAWISTLCALITFFIVKYYRALGWRQVSVFLAVVVFLIPPVMIVSIGTHLPPEYEYRVSEELRSLFVWDVSEQHRIEQYPIVGDILIERPFFGLGVGNYTQRFEELNKKKGYLSLASSKTTDNMYLLFVAETGLLGVVSIVILLFYIFYHLLFLIHTSPSFDKAPIFAALVGGCVNMFTWDAMYQPTFRILFWVLVGVGYVSRKGSVCEE